MTTSRQAAVAALRRAAVAAATPAATRAFGSKGVKVRRGCCSALATEVNALVTAPYTYVTVHDAFLAVFRPTDLQGAYWWPTPHPADAGYASNGKTYKPSDARCLALLLMAEMVRTGDV